MNAPRHVYEVYIRTTPERLERTRSSRGTRCFASGTRTWRWRCSARQSGERTRQTGAGMIPNPGLC